jgi:hypothetical protein
VTLDSDSRNGVNSLLKVEKMTETIPGDREFVNTIQGKPRYPIIHSVTFRSSVEKEMPILVSCLPSSE